MTNSPRSRFRLPHWGWFLLPSVVLLVGLAVLSFWLPRHRDQQFIKRIESWGGSVGTETGGPAWLRYFAGESLIEELQAFNRIVDVRLEASATANAEIAYLSRLTNLEYLSLRGRAVTDASLAHLSRLTNLKDIDLTQTAVTDAGLVHLSKLTNLHTIDLHFAPVTDAGLAQFRELKKLRYLYLYGTRVTDGGVEELQRALPDCEIGH